MAGHVKRLVAFGGVRNGTVVTAIRSGFDAGIRYEGTVPEDMTLGGGRRACLSRALRLPATPQDLQEHRCVRIGLGNDQVYKCQTLPV